MNKKRFTTPKGKARLANRVNSTRRLHLPRKPHPRQPVPSVGMRARVLGRTYFVIDAYEDRVALVGPADAKVPTGLLVHWMNWTWRVLYVNRGEMAIEAWGESFLNSDKLVEYV